MDKYLITSLLLNYWKEMKEGSTGDLTRNHLSSIPLKAKDHQSLPSEVTKIKFTEQKEWKHSCLY